MVLWFLVESFWYSGVLSSLVVVSSWVFFIDSVNFRLL